MSSPSTEPQHTPGPWKTFYTESMNRWWVAMDTGEGNTTIGIADVSKERDARLIAQAPALLKALEEIMEMWPGEGLPIGADTLALFAEANRIARTAIAEVRGNQL